MGEEEEEEEAEEEAREGNMGDEECAEEGVVGMVQGECVPEEERVRIQGEESTSNGVPGSSNEVPGSSDGAPGSSKGVQGSSNAVPGSRSAATRDGVPSTSKEQSLCPSPVHVVREDSTDVAVQSSGGGGVTVSGDSPSTGRVSTATGCELVNRADRDRGNACSTTGAEAGRGASCPEERGACSIPSVEKLGQHTPTGDSCQAEGKVAERGLGRSTVDWESRRLGAIAARLLRDVTVPSAEGGS